MDKGYIDQLIGEDGNFYYKLTDKGNKVAKYIKAIIPIDSGRFIDSSKQDADWLEDEDDDYDDMDP